jgi:Tfp pilus assembly protein PilO
LQDLTESKDIIQRELEETNCWYDNQQQLVGDLEKANESVAQLEEQRDILTQQARVNQELHKRLLEQHGFGRCHKLAQPETSPQPERMSITNAVVKEFFRKPTTE